MISLCLIVKPTDEEADFLDKALFSTSQFVDEICLTLTGKNEKCEEVIKKYSQKYKVKVSYFEWKEDFAEARNFNFKQAEGDWILWMDADDTFRGLENLKILIEEANKIKVKGIYFPYEYNHDKNGNVTELHFKLQLISNDNSFEWKGSIHEDLIMKGSVKIARDNCIVRVHHSNPKRSQENFLRNIRMLMKELEREGDNPDPRTLYYLGQSFVGIKEYEKAILLLEEYLKKSNWDEEKYRAYHLLAECFIAKNDLDKALELYNQSILEKDNYPDAYFNKAYLYFEKKDYKRAITNLKIGLSFPIPQSMLIYNPFNYSKHPLSILAASYLHIGKLEEAEKYILMAEKVDNKDEDIRFLKNLILDVKEKKDIARLYFKIASYLEKIEEKEKIYPLLAGVPKTIIDNAYITTLTKKYLSPCKWREKEIAIYCGTSAEEWSPLSINKGGIGGSETAVIFLAELFQRMGYKVEVFNNCGTMKGNYKGVEYRNYWEFNWQDEFNILICWRLPELFDIEIKAKLKICDLHDVMNPYIFNSDRLKNIDKIFVKSNYHKSLYLNVPEEKFEIISNGIDLKRFKEKRKRKKGKCIYSSSPNRGLDIVLKNWKKIKKEIPEAELHIFYGWKTFYELEKNNPQSMKFMKEIEELRKQEGVIWRGRVGQKELALEMLESDLWLYPTYFPEINCITALECQMAGVIPIVTNYAALRETVDDRAYKIEGDIYNPKIQEKWTNKVIEVLKDRGREELRKKLKDYAKNYSWEDIAQKWVSIFNKFNL